MDGLATAALIVIILFFIAPPIIGAIVGAVLWKSHRGRGALAGGAGGLLVGWIVFRLVTASENVMPSPPPDRPATKPAPVAEPLNPEPGP